MPATKPQPLEATTLSPLESAPRGKFVVLADARRTHLALSSIEKTPFHAQIVQDYLESRGLAQVEAPDGNDCRILTPGWRILGGGYYEIDRENRQLRFFGRSTAFGRYPRELLLPHLNSLNGALGVPDLSVRLD